MRGRRLLPWVAIAVFTWAHPARAQLAGSAEIGAGGGYDSNPLLQVSPDATLGDAPGGAYAGVEATLAAAWLGDVARATVAYAYELKTARGATRLMFHDAELRLTLAPRARWRPYLAAEATAFDGGADVADAFMTGGGAVGFDASLTRSGALGLRAAYHLATRRLLDRTPVENDWVHLVEARVDGRIGAGARLGLGGTHLAIAPRGETVRFTRTQAGLDLLVTRAPLGFFAETRTARLEFLDAREWQAGAACSLRWDLGEHFGVALQAELTTPLGGGTALYSRRLVGAAVYARLGGQTARRVEPRTPPAHASLLGGVRFAVLAPGAASVVVIGSWNDWAPEGVALHPTASQGTWEVRVVLPPGSHRYRFVIDGRTVVPSDAARYVPDGFGGRDAVVDVEPAPIDGATMPGGAP